MTATPKPDKIPGADRPVPPTRADAEHSHPTAVPQPAAGGAIVLAPGQRLLPEYELVAFLGRGGFGEVWKARGPGGFQVALKIVRLGQPAGDTELRALELMKDVRHAHLLAVFGAWQRDGLLLMAMELADGTLLGRLRQAEGEGHTGIPRDELLEYLREAAKGLDFLNECRVPVGGGGGTAGIQHKDVKPQNLLLVGGAVKVADFGLARVLEHTVTAASGGLTPSYAAPEFFNGRATRWSDQYSLAVAYCELRGGRLPYEGSALEIMAGHVTRPPDLTMLPNGERATVARALAKKPEERWPSCRAFAEALAEAGRLPPAPPRPAPVPARPEREVTPARQGDEAGRQPPPQEGPEGAGPDARSPSLSGEALLARRYQELLKGTRGRPAAGDKEALVALCREHGIPAERANAILRRVHAGWRAEHRGPRGAGEARTAAPSPPTPPAGPAPSPVREAAPRVGEKLPGARPSVGEARRAPRWRSASPVRRAAWGALGVISLAIAGILLSRQVARQTAPRSTARGGGAGTLQEVSSLPKRADELEREAGPQKGAPFTNTVGMEFVWIEPGSFMMGSPADEPERSNDETPHRVTLTEGFHMSAYLVTQEQWERVLGKDVNRSRFLGKDEEQKRRLPVDNVSWFDCVAFCNKLNEQEGRKPRFHLTSRGDGEVRRAATGYRLPTEAEWEFACRAGTATAFWWGSTITTDQANYDGNYTYGQDGKKGEYRQRTTPVGLFPANPRGLHDMGGNLHQWCEDWYAPYPAGDATDPLNIAKGPDSPRVLRGCSWYDRPWHCRAARRLEFAPSSRNAYCGCRVVLPQD
jgi:formylglycine-generating enzyme required for sulfatase activity/serine/threonine protein kinase